MPPSRPSRQTPVSQHSGHNAFGRSPGAAGSSTATRSSASPAQAGRPASSSDRRPGTCARSSSDRTWPSSERADASGLPSRDYTSDARDSSAGSGRRRRAPVERLVRIDHEPTAAAVDITGLYELRPLRAARLMGVAVSVPRGLPSHQLAALNPSGREEVDRARSTSASLGEDPPLGVP